MLLYVDPGAGSFILQALVAALAGAIVALNAYWTRIVKFFRGTSSEPDEGKQVPDGGNEVPHQGKRVPHQGKEVPGGDG
jgi:hypothetical protein